MASEFSFDVFLSHSTRDKVVVRQLATRLKADGIRVWMADEQIKVGDSIPARIEQGLEHSRVLVLCLSANAFGSDWTHLEAGTFRFRDPLNKERRFLPLRLDNAPVKGSLAQFLCSDWRPEARKAEYPKLLEACRPPHKPSTSDLFKAQERFQTVVLSLGHTDSVRSVVWSPDGQRALSGSNDKTLRVWDAETGSCLRVLEGHTANVSSVAWSPDGRRVLSGSNDKTLRMWDIETGCCLRVLEGHSANVLSVAWSPDGQGALSGSVDKTLRVWEVETGRCLHVLEGHSANVWSVAWSPDGRRVLSGADDKTVRVWEVETGRCLRVFEGHSETVSEVAWSPDGRHALSGSTDKTLRVWDVAGNGRCLHILKGHAASVMSIAWSPDGRRVLSGADDKTVRVWELKAGRCLRVLKGHTAVVLSVKWSPDGRRALSGAADQTVRMWDVETGRCLKVLQGHVDSVSSVAWSLDKRLALSGAADKTVRVWEMETGRCLKVLEGHSASVWSVAWSSDGRRILVGVMDNTVWVWEVETGRCLRVLEGHTKSVLSVAWSPDGRRALSGAADQTVRMWDVETGRCLRVLEGHTNAVESVAWSPDKRFVLSGAYDNTVRVWDVETGRCLHVLEGHTDSVLSVAWSLDGQCVLSGATDKTVRVWDVETGRCLRVLEGHTASVWSLAWSPDGRQALSGAADKTVRVWEVETGRCLRVLEGHTNSVVSVAWNPDGPHIFSAASNCVMRIWDLESAEFAISPSQKSPKTEFVRYADAKAFQAWENEGGNHPPSKWPFDNLEPEFVQYANAKVLLVGETGAGKSALALRLLHGKFVATKSSHARQAHVLESKTIPGVDGVPIHRETVLWDLAGQPAYRLVHQLSMEGAVVACVLFDNRKETNPFDEATYWSQVLDQARTDLKVRKILVASRTDVGGLPASRDRIEEFKNQHGFAQFIPTSAHSGEGCDDLLKAIQAGIPWDELPKVTTEGPLAQLRAHVAELKGEKYGRASITPMLFTVAQLHEGFVSNYGRKIPLEEFIAHLERLEATDAIDLLVFHSTGARARPETLVLLDPTRVDAYASAMLIAARDEPDGPGHLLESRVREVEFRIGSEERLADAASEKHVVWFVLENLMSRDLALRERIQGKDYFVFPSQCTAELRYPGVAAFSVALGFKGPVRSIYATLIAQLAHFDGFKRREFFHDAATYHPKLGGKCIVRLHDSGRGEGELELSFEAETTPSVRQGFIEFVGKHLAAKSDLESVTKRHAYHCLNQDCRKPFEDALVKARLEARKKYLPCPYCEKKTPLADLLAPPTADSASVAVKMETDARVGRKRMTAALVIKAKEAEGIFDVFLSHNSKDKAAVEKLGKRLLSVGIRPWLDKWNLAPGDTLLDALEKAVKTIPCAVLCFGPGDVGKWHITEIRAYVEKWAGGEARMIPLVLPKVKDMPELPLFIRQTLWVDMRDWENDDNEGFYRLVCGIVEKEPGASPRKRFGPKDVMEWQGRDRPC